MSAQHTNATPNTPSFAHSPTKSVRFFFVVWFSQKGVECQQAGGGVGYVAVLPHSSSWSAYFSCRPNCSATKAVMPCSACACVCVCVRRICVPSPCAHRGTLQSRPFPSQRGWSGIRPPVSNGWRVCVVWVSERQRIKHTWLARFWGTSFFVASMMAIFTLSSANCTNRVSKVGALVWRVRHTFEATSLYGAIAAWQWLHHDAYRNRNTFGLLFTKSSAVEPTSVVRPFFVGVAGAGSLRTVARCVPATTLSAKPFTMGFVNCRGACVCVCHVNTGRQKVVSSAHTWPPAFRA